MICENMTIGTRVDNVAQEEITDMCMSMKKEISSQIEKKLNSSELTNMMKMAFKVPQPRPAKNQNLLTASSTSQDKARVSEMMLSEKEDCVVEHKILESKKSLKIVELLTQFEEHAFAMKLVDNDSLTRLRKLSRVLLYDALKVEEIFKFAHLETIVISIITTATALAALSFKRVFGILQTLFGKKIKLSKIRKTKGYELMKRIGFRVWDVY